MRHQTCRKTATSLFLLSLFWGLAASSNFSNHWAQSASPQKRSSNPPASATAAEPLRQTFMVDGQERVALVFKNRAPTPASGAPLVFAFHGHGGLMRTAANRFNLHGNWQEAIVIYPQGLATPGMYDPEGKKSGWQKAAGELGDRDLKFVDAMLEWAKKSFRVDARRVYATGHSNGGAFTYLLWMARSEAFAAFAPSAAAFGRKAIGVKITPKPILMLAGEKDELVRFDIQQRSHNYALRVNRCEAAGGDFGDGIKLYKSQVAADTALFIHPGGHEVPQNFGELVTRFFKAYRRE